MNALLRCSASFHALSRRSISSHLQPLPLHSARSALAVLMPWSSACVSVIILAPLRAPARPDSNSRCRAPSSVSFAKTRYGPSMNRNSPAFAFPEDSRSRSSSHHVRTTIGKSNHPASGKRLISAEPDAPAHRATCGHVQG